MSGVLIYSMNVSADGFIADRSGGTDWGGSSEEVFQHWVEQVASLGGYLLGRRLHETMLVWETDASLRETSSGAEFAAAWSALPKVVFSRSLDQAEGTARLADRPVAEEIATALAATDRDVAIGGADLAAQAIRLDLVDEFRLVRSPVLLGGGVPYFPPLPERRSLELIETRTFDTGASFERYHRR